jgi:hypothetical protein
METDRYNCVVAVVSKYLYDFTSESVDLHDSTNGFKVSIIRGYWLYTPRGMRTLRIPTYCQTKAGHLEADDKTKRSVVGVSKYLRT